VDRLSTDARAAAVAAALSPYAWRQFTAQMVARRVVAAVDRHGLHDFVSNLPGADVGDCAPVEPADANDERVEALVHLLAARNWRAYTLGWLCAELTAALDAWRTARESLDSALRQLMDEH
jgi:hypothetical protein